MTGVRRTGFDGSHISDSRRGIAWLIIDGERYTLEGEAADALLKKGARPIEAPELIEDLPIGGGILAGSSLVRTARDAPIHLFAVDRPDCRLHLIRNWESFADFGFDPEKVKIVPEALLRPVPEGVEIWSARDRLARKGHSMYLPLLEVLD